MIWQNPWAWLGLAALAVPVLIHLLGRRSARAQRFPTLRFIEASAPVATRRTRLTDIPLLLVRMAILLAAVTALALPFLLTADRERDLGRAIARAIIVDTSESVRRARVPDDTAPAPDGRESALALDGARGEARRLAGEARTSVVVETSVPASAVAGADAWLRHQHGRRELLVISDFQTSALDSSDLANVAPDVGIRLVRVGGVRIPDSSRVRDSVPETIGLTLLTGSAESARADAAVRAAAILVAPPRLPVDRPVAVVHRGFEGRGQLLATARAPSAAWQGDLLVRLRNDPALLAAAADIDPAAVDADSTRAVSHAVVARTWTGRPLITAAADRPEDHERLLLFVHTDAGSLLSAALIAAVARATSPASPVAEREPTTVDSAALARWERAPAASTSTRSPGDAGESDGRWLWLLALALLGVESWLRRGQRVAKPAEVVHERAA